MDAPTISIKIRGLQAVEALNRGQLLGGIKINGANAMMMGGMDGGNRAIMAKNGLMMREVEIEGNRMMLAQSKGMGTMGNVGNMGMAKGPAASAAVGGTKSATVNGAAALTTTKSAGGAALSAKSIGSVGWGLGLGGLGPWLVLGSLGLAATGIYFYLRAQRMMLEGGADDFDDR